jgi:hypothetical protein
MLADRAKECSERFISAHPAMNSLSLDGRHRFTGIYDRRGTVVCENIWRNFSEDVVGSEVPKDAT